MQPQTHITEITELTALPLPSLRRAAYSLRRAGRTIPQIARKIGRTFNETADIIDEGRTEYQEREHQQIWAAARRSVLARPSTDMRSAA